MLKQVNIFQYLANCRSLVRWLAADGDGSLRFDAVIGNTGCDPDSIIGSLLASIVRTIELNQHLPTFQTDFRSMLGESIDFGSLMMNKFRPVVPLINSSDRNLVKDKRDVLFLDSKFKLGVTDMLTYTEFADLLEGQQGIDLTLFDFNLPNAELNNLLTAKNGKISLVIDHHSIVDQAFVASIDQSIIESSASCISVLLRHTNASVIDLCCSLLPELCKAACCIIDFDAFSFPEAEKDIRWWQKDLDLLLELQGRLGYQVNERVSDVKQLLAAQYSDLQFESTLNHLLTLDSKTFDYTPQFNNDDFPDGSHVKIIYSSLPNTIDRYLQEYGNDITDSLAIHFTQDIKAIILLFIFVDVDQPDQSKRSILIATKDRAFVERLVAAIDPVIYPVAVTYDDPRFKQQGLQVHLIDSLRCNLSRKIVEKLVRSTI